MAPRRKPFSPAHVSLRRRLSQSRTSIVLTERQIRDLEERMQVRFKWSNGPRRFQVDGVKAQLEGHDAIIQAPTGAGKTAVVAGPYTMPELLGRRTITIMVVPLLALQEEMERTFIDEFGLSAVAVNSAHGLSTPGLVKDLRTGRYNVVLISPEMLQSRTFVDRVLRHQNFSSRVLSMVIDEAHCVSHWGSNFRKKYASIGTTRAFLPRGTPVIAVTATLTARVRRDLQHKLHFPSTGGLFYNAGNDRPNVSIVVRALEHAQNTFADLDFVIPDTLAQPSDIPKTYIYADDIKVGTGIVDHLNTLIAKHQIALSEGLVRPYNATLSAPYRTEAMQQFQQGTIRVLVCTDAAGMGCNVPDVDVVVQWKMPKSLSQFIQRAGRAARRHNHKGLSVLLVERSAYSVYLNDKPGEPPVQSQVRPNQSSTKTKSTRLPSDSKTKAPKGYAAARGIQRGGTKCHDEIIQPVCPPLDLECADEALLVFIQTTMCRRQVWLSMFNGSVTTDTERPVPCCDICQPTLLDRTRPGRKPANNRRKGATKGAIDRTAYLKLDDWRETIFSRDFTNQTQFDAEAILPNTLLIDIVSSPPTYLSAKDGLAKQLRASWLWWEKYGAELLEFVKAVGITYTPLDKKNTRATTAPSNPIASASQKRPHEDDEPSTARPAQVPTSERAKRARTGTHTAVPVYHRSGTLTEAERAPYVYSKSRVHHQSTSYPSPDPQRTDVHTGQYSWPSTSPNYTFAAPLQSYQAQPYPWPHTPTHYGARYHAPYAYPTRVSPSQAPAGSHFPPSNTPPSYPQVSTVPVQQPIQIPLEDRSGTSSYYQYAATPQTPQTLQASQTPTHPPFYTTSGSYDYQYRSAIWQPPSPSPSAGTHNTGHAG